MNQEAGWRGQTKGKDSKAKQSKTLRAKLHGLAQLCMSAAIICWPTADLSVNCEIL